jgi:hypothetical protein
MTPRSERLRAMIDYLIYADFALARREFSAKRAIVFKRYEKNQSLAAIEPPQPRKEAART